MKKCINCNQEFEPEKGIGFNPDVCGPCHPKPDCSQCSSREAEIGEFCYRCAYDAVTDPTHINMEAPKEQFIQVSPFREEDTSVVIGLTNRGRVFEHYYKREKDDSPLGWKNVSVWDEFELPDFTK